MERPVYPAVTIETLLAVPEMRLKRGWLKRTAPCAKGELEDFRHVYVCASNMSGLSIVS